MIIENPRILRKSIHMFIKKDELIVETHRKR